VEVNPNDYVTKDALYDAFQKYCVKQCLPVSKPNSFGRSLQNQTEYRIHSARPEIDGERVTVWQGIKLCVKDVKDVNVISLSKGHAGKNDDTYTGIKLGENPGNPDAPASDTHEYQNPDTTPKKPDENGPSSSYDSASTNTGGHKGGEQC